MFKSVESLCVEYEESGAIQDDWKDGLEDYLDNNINS